MVHQHISTIKKDVLILGKRPVDELDDTTITEEYRYSFNITKSNTKICLNLHYN